MRLGITMLRCPNSVIVEVSKQGRKRQTGLKLLWGKKWLAGKMALEDEVFCFKNTVLTV